MTFMKYLFLLTVLFCLPSLASKAQTRQETIEWLGEKLNAYGKLSPCSFRFLDDSKVIVDRSVVNVTYTTSDAIGSTTTVSELRLSLYDVISYELPQYGCQSHSIILKTYGNKISVSWKKSRTYSDSDGNAQSDDTSGDYKTASVAINTDGFSEPNLISRFARAVQNLIAANKQDLPQEKY